MPRECGAGAPPRGRCARCSATKSCCSGPERARDARRRSRARELDAALEGLRVDLLGPRQIAQLEHDKSSRGRGDVIVVIDSIRIAARPAVADIEHQIDLDRGVVALARDGVGELDARQLQLFGEDVDQRPVAGGCSSSGIGGSSAARLGRRLRDEPELAQHRAQPFVDPRLAEEEVQVVGRTSERELLLGLGILGRRDQVRLVLGARPEDEVGIEGDDDAVTVAVAVALGELGDVQARPVRRTAVEDLVALGVEPEEAEHRQRHPLVEEDADRVAEATGVRVFVGDRFRVVGSSASPVSGSASRLTSPRPSGVCIS